MRGARIQLDRVHTDGFWEFVGIGNDLYYIGGDTISDQPREERVPSEDCYEFFFKLSGRLWLDAPNVKPLLLEGPALFMLRQSKGISLRARVDAHIRQTSLAVFCRPSLLAELMELPPGGALSVSPGLRGLDSMPLLCRQLTVTPGLLCCAKRLLECRLEGRLRMLQQEAKILEFVCLIVAELTKSPMAHGGARLTDGRLDRARDLLHSDTSAIPNLRTIAKTVGVSKSKLKQDFKARFGKTVFEYALDRRMAVALDLLRAGNMPVGAVAATVGYRHHTSFTTAFQRYHGFSPKAVIGG